MPSGPSAIWVSALHGMDASIGTTLGRPGPGWMEQETHLLGPCRKLPTMPRACRLIDICSASPPSGRRWMISISKQGSRGVALAASISGC
jgi:hypothetical protein